MKVIKQVARLRNTSSGNPRHVVTFTDKTVAYVADDAQVNHTIENSEFLDTPLDVEYDEKGRITQLTPLT